MIIVINALSARRGGGQTYLLNLLAHIEALGDSTIYLLAPESFDTGNRLAVKRIQINLPTENPLIRAIWEKLFFPKLLRQLKADILFCPGGLINTDVPKGCRTVTMFRNMIPFDQAIRALYPPGLARVRNWLLKREMLASMQQADLVIFISEYARGVIERFSSKTLKKALTIPHGISNHFRVDPLNEPLRPEGLPRGEYLLYVSIFEPYKHHLEVVRGFHRLKSMRTTHEKLLLAGKNDMPSGTAVKEEIIKLGLQDDVILIGNINYQQLPAYYRHAKINIFASGCENCPNILLEALGAGRPLLVSNIQPMPEFGENAAIYFDPANPKDFARQAMSIIDFPEELNRLGHLASEQNQKYNWPETARRTWAAFWELHQAQFLK